MENNKRKLTLKQRIGEGIMIGGIAMIIGGAAGGLFLQAKNEQEAPRIYQVEAKLRRINGLDMARNPGIKQEYHVWESQYTSLKQNPKMAQWESDYEKARKLPGYLGVFSLAGFFPLGYGLHLLMGDEGENKKEN
ncbi:hypothetical protein HY643_03160 [Candidatus Woesearchaeota archaeon]|nr:hypothetical protein [Candidatus Woesearchaeota archaeon]